MLRKRTKRIQAFIIEVKVSLRVSKHLTSDLHLFRVILIGLIKQTKKMIFLTLGKKIMMKRN